MGLNIIYSIIILFIGFQLPKTILTRKFARHYSIAYKLLILHFLTSIGYFYLTNNGGGDAWIYWYHAEKLDFHAAKDLLVEAKGTYFMYAFNYIFAGFLKMNFFANTLAFSLIGYAGLLYFYRIALTLLPDKVYFKSIQIFPNIFFLPMLHFWSSGVGKDTLIFYAIALFCFCIERLGTKIVLLGISLLLTYLVRPHIALLLIVSFGFASIVDKKTKIGKKLFFISTIIVGVILILPYIMEYVQLDNLSVESIESNTGERAEKLSRNGTGSSIDISSYPLPLKILTFLYRPLFFDFNGLPSLVASFENLLLLILSFSVLFNKPIDTFKAAPLLVKFFVIFLILGALAFGSSLGNLGIMIRMRNMFLPGMMIYICWSIYLNGKKQIQKRN